VYNYETQELLKMTEMLGVTVAKWHPRKKDCILFGTNIATVHFFNVAE